MNRISKFIKTGLFLFVFVALLISSAEAVKGDKRITKTFSLKNGLDVLLVSGLGSLETDHPEVSVLIPAAYIVHEIQGVRMLKALNRVRETQC